MGLICPISACATGAPIHFVVLCTMTSLVSFYATHWEHYFTGVMEFGAFGPCELHYAVILGLLVMACAGKPLSQWTYPLGIPAGTAVNLFFAGIIAVSLFMTYVSISHVLTDDEDNSSNDANSTYVFNNDDNFKYRKRRSSALRGFIPCLLFVFLSCLWALVEYDALVAMPHVFVLTYALVFAYVAQRLIVQRVCSEPLVMVYPIFIPLFLCSVNGALGIISSKAMAYTMLGISVAQEIIFSVSFINQLSGFLHIRPFVVSKVRFDDDDDDDDNESDDE